MSMRRLGWNPRPATQRSFPLRPEGLNNAAAGGLLLLLLSTGLLNELLNLVLSTDWTEIGSTSAIRIVLHILSAVSGALFVGGLLHAGWEIPDRLGGPRLTRQAPELPRALRWKLYVIPLVINLVITTVILSV